MLFSGDLFTWGEPDGGKLGLSGGEGGLTDSPRYNRKSSFVVLSFLDYLIFYFKNSKHEDVGLFFQTRSVT